MTATLVAFAVLALTTSIRQQPSAGVKTYAVSGRVIDGTTGGSINDTVVVFWERSRDRPSGRRIPSSNGTFVIPNVTPGTYTMAAEVPGGRFSYRTETVDVEIRDRDVTGLGLIITPLGPRATSVTGRFIMENNGTLPPFLTRITAAGESSAIQRDGTFQLRLRAEEKYRIRLDNLPEGTYVKAVSTGFWNAEAETLLFSSTPPATLQITLAIGNRAVRGRVRQRTGIPGSNAVVSLYSPSSSVPLRSVSANAEGTFEIDRLRAGEYKLNAKLGSGTETQTASLPLTVGTQDRIGIEVMLKGMTPQKGRVVIEGAGRVEELQRFRPMIEVTDVLGVHRVPIGADGTFDFQSFEDEYSVAIKDVPLGYDKSITVTGSTVEVKLRVIQGDGFGRFRPLQPR